MANAENQETADIDIQKELAAENGLDAEAAAKAEFARGLEVAALRVNARRCGSRSTVAVDGLLKELEHEIRNLIPKE